MGNLDLEIIATRPDSDESRVLILALDADLQRRYPGVHINGFHPQDLTDPRLLFLVARIQGRAVGCGGVRELERGVGEVKRMFVVPECRGRGVARRLLESLEGMAQARGYSVLRIETALGQPEAIALYGSAGYKRISPFGEYTGNAYSVCFEKKL